MWCARCQQDVPGVASAARSHAIVCVRCGQPLSNTATSSRSSAPAGGSAPADSSPPAGAGTPTASDPPERPTFEPADDWHWLDEIEPVRPWLGLANVPEIESALSASTAPPDPPAAPAGGGAPHSVRTRYHARVRSRSRARRQPLRRGQGGRAGAIVSWMFLLTGLMALACGAVLMVWSFVAGRNELWTVGTPLALAGQAGILLGVVFQMEGLWQCSQDTAQSLHELDHQLTDLQQAATLLHTRPGSATQTYYAHLAEGASPHLVLADLRGQLDMLAARMARP